ncbi:MAG: 2-oxo acid dehydrogenase subunit E2 [Burkholderiales bacterium]|nr:2-oxo acid dehydrogenase subunit E2 [Burkholderiales bacterium]
MGQHVIKMPDIGEGIAEVELVAWHVKPGDAVVEDQPLADVMTDKASVEIPSPVAGTVLALGGEVGQTLAVGSELIRIETGAGQGAPSGKASAPPAAAAGEPPAPPPAAAAMPMHAPAEHSAERPRASPSVRRQATELGLDLRAVAGTGPGGRIVHADLEAAAAVGRAPAPAVAARAPARPPAPVAAPGEDEQAIPIIGVRRKIAQKMQEAKRRIPHFTYVEEVDVTELEDLRARLNAQWAGQRPKLTLLPFLIRAVVRGVREFPQVNARFDDDAGIVTRYRSVHVGIATQTDVGLMVPVLRHAEALDLWASAAEVARVAEGARGGKMSRDELIGSTITITSLGALGGIVTTPVINHPEVAIVGVNRIVERPMFRGAAVVPRLLMNLSSSFDHRIVDGIDAARFVQTLRGFLEAPATLFID